MRAERPRQFSKVGEIEFALPPLLVEVLAFVEFLALGFNAEDSMPFPLS
jgi:hypothetical protein